MQFIVVAVRLNDLMVLRSHPVTVLCCNQERREKFRAPRQKFRLGPLISGAPKSSDEQKKGHSVRRCSNFAPKSKKHHRLLAKLEILKGGGS